MRLQTLIVSFAALAGVTTAQAETYYWDKSAAEGAFADKSKWFLDAECTQPANAVPNYGDEAVISTPAQLTLADGNSNIGTFTMNAAVTFVSGALRFDTLSGSGTLTVGETVSFVSTINKAQVNVPIDIPEGSTLVTKTSGDTYRGFRFNGKITGKGLLKTGVQGKQRQYTYLECDMRDFEGSVEIVDDGISRHDFRIGANGYSEKARWSGKTSGGGSAINQAGTYKLGAFKGWWYQLKSSDYAFNKNITMEIGALNAEDDSLGGSLSRDANRTDDGVNVRKVGTGTMEFSASGAQSLQIAGGSVRLAADSALSYSDNNQTVKSYINFVSQDASGGGALKVDAAVTRDVSRWLKNSTTAPIVFDDEGRDWTWNTAIDASNTAGFTKRGNGTLTLAKVPKYTGSTVVEAGVLALAAGATLEELTVADGAQLALYTTAGYEEPTPVLTINKVNLAEGQTLRDILPDSQTIGFEFTEGEDGVVIVLATRPPVTFTWTNATGDSAWETIENWQIGTEVATELPKVSDTVVFPESEADWSVTLTKDVTVKGFVVNQAISLSGAHVMVAGQEVRSDIDVAPTVTLGDDAGLCATTEADAKLTVNVPLCITASEGHTARVAGRWVQSSSGGATITINEKVTGSGYLEVRGVRAKLYLKGDLSEFTGHLSVPDDTSLAGAHRMTVTIAEGPNEAASWSVSGENNDGSATFTWPAGKTYKFGSFNGSLRLNTTQSNYLRQVLEIGAVEGSENSLSGDLFKNSYISLIGSWTSTADNSNRGHTIRKVGNSHMTFSAVHAKAFEINGGTFEVTRNESYYNTWTEKEATEPSIYNIKIGFKGQGGTLVMPEAVTFDPSASIIDSTAPISIDTATDRTWAVPLAASNVGGLVKKGEGTLTLAEVPAYTGVTTVEAGKLVVPEGSRIHWDILSAGALTGVQPTSYDYQVGTTNVYDSTVTVPSAGDHTLNLDNLLAIDLTLVATVERNSKFVIAEAKAFNVDGKAITKAGREKIELIWGKDTVFPKGKTAADYTLQVVNGQLVVANKAVGIAIIIK